MENICGGVCVERFIQYEALAEYCMILETPTLALFMHISIADALSVVVPGHLARRDFCGTQTTAGLVIRISVSV